MICTPSTMIAMKIAKKKNGERAEADRGAAAPVAPRLGRARGAVDHERVRRGDRDAGDQRDPDDLDDLAEFDDRERHRAPSGETEAPISRRAVSTTKPSSNTVTRMIGPVAPTPKIRTTP